MKWEEEMKAEYNHLPENWTDLTGQQKNVWFARHCVNYTREGEVDGIRDDVPEDVMRAYQAFRQENNE